MSTDPSPDTDSPSTKPPATPGWVPIIRGLCVLVIAAIAIYDLAVETDEVPLVVYASIVGLGLGIDPGVFGKAAKALSGG